MTIPTTTVVPLSDKFNFKLDELVQWVIRLNDGTIIRHQLNGKSFTESAKKPTTSYLTPRTTYPVGLSSYCTHTPNPDVELFQKDKIKLYVANADGARKSTDPAKFDLIIDGGNVISPPSRWVKSLLNTSVENFETLTEFEVQPAPPSYVDFLKIDWDDRQAPKLKPSFWPALAAKLEENAKASANEDYRVITSCQGGHGRSGSAAVCLMMCFSDYDALDAITHLRAVHCPRAIESHVQHEYIDTVATFLGRTANAKDALKVPDFRKRFLTLTAPQAKPYQDRLIALAKASDDVKRDEDDDYGYGYGV